MGSLGERIEQLKRGDSGVVKIAAPPHTIESVLSKFLPRYAELDLLRGQTVRVEQGGQWREGTALGLADDGALRVCIDGVEQHVHAGEVSVRAQ
jgi:biotin-(acetyl-CoA carboxylase) ligase